MSHQAALSLLLPFVFACGSMDGPGATHPMDPMNPDPVKTTQVSLSLGPVTVQPGAEVTQCYTGHFTNTLPMDVVQIDSQLFSTHHVIFYREDPTATDAPVHECQALNINPFGQSQKAPLFIGETEKATLKLPAGVAYEFAAGAPYTLEVHFINASTKPIDGTATVTLTLAPTSAQITKADMLFYATIRALSSPGLPPHETTILPPSFHQPPAGINVFGLTSHQHRIGSDFTIAKSAGKDDPGQMLFENKDWQHPPLLRFPDDKLLTFDPQKGEGLKWQCSYNNTNDFTVKFGQSAFTNEMCILWAYYYPAQGFDVYFE